MICCCCHEWILLERKQGLTQNREARSLEDGRGSCAASTPTLVVVAAAAGAVARVHNLRIIKWIDFCLILSELHRQSFSTQNCKSLPSFSTQNYQNPSFLQDPTLRIPSFLQDPKLQILSLSTQNCESLSSGPQKIHESFLQLPICNTWFVDCLLAASKDKGWIQPTNDNTCPIQSSSTSVIPNTWNHCVCVCLCVDCLFVCAQLFIRLSFFVFVFLADVQQQAISHSNIAIVCRERERERRGRKLLLLGFGDRRSFAKSLSDRKLARSLSLSLVVVVVVVLVVLGGGVWFFFFFFFPAVVGKSGRDWRCRGSRCCRCVLSRPWSPWWKIRRTWSTNSQPARFVSVVLLSLSLSLSLSPKSLFLATSLSLIWDGSPSELTFWGLNLLLLFLLLSDIPFLHSEK